MGNITENKINQTIVAADITAINTAIDSIASKIPKVSLTDEQRASLLGLDVDNKIFVEDVINEVSISGAGIIPPFISAANIQTDLALFEQLDAIESALDNLLTKVRDVKRAAADDAMTASNAVYKMFEMANAVGVPNAKQPYEKLKERYRKQSGVNPPLNPVI